MDNCKRYDGRLLHESAHIVVLGSSKVGNFIITIPLLKALRRKYPKAKIDFWGSEITKDFEDALCNSKKGRKALLNWRVSWDTDNDDKFIELARYADTRGKPDLLLNCDGFNPITKVISAWLRPEWIAGASTDKKGRNDLAWGELDEQKFLADQDWETKEFLGRYRHLLEDQYIANLMCLMGFIKPTKEDLVIDLPSRQPNFEVPNILIHCTSTRRAKIWGKHKWKEVINYCLENELSVGIIGAAAKTQREEYNSGNDEDDLMNCFEGKYLATGEPILNDLRGRTSLIELVGACKHAKGVISVDAGPLHVAAASGKPVLAVVGNDKEGIGASPINLWLPRADNIRRTTSKQRCTKCLENKFKNNECLEKEHICMESVEVEEVIAWIKQLK